MKPLLLILVLFVITPAQTPCNLTLDKSPEVRGLKLGQSSKVFLTAVEELRLREREPTDLGITELTASSYANNNVELLHGLDTISVKYLDDKLASIEIDYAIDVRWKSDAHLAAAISDQLGLPSQGWVGMAGRNPRLNCNGFFVEVRYAFLGGVLRIENSNLQKEIAQRTALREEKKRAAFKP